MNVLIVFLVSMGFFYLLIGAPVDSIIDPVLFLGIFIWFYTLKKLGDWLCRKLNA